MLEFQYRSKLEALERENNELREELMKRPLNAPKEIPVSLHDEIKENLAPPKAQTRLSGDREERDAYRAALEKAQEEDWSDLIVAMESFVQRFPKSEFADNALYWIAQVYWLRNERDLCRAELNRLIRLYPQGDRRIHALKLLDRIEQGERPQ